MTIQIFALQSAVCPRLHHFIPVRDGTWLLAPLDIGECDNNGAIGLRDFPLLNETRVAGWD